MNLSEERIWEKLTSYWRQNEWDFGNKKILLAVSGGKDSMLLARIAVEFEWDFALAHANFQLRAEESEGDEKFVGDWCKENGIPFYSRKFDLEQVQTKNTQIAARTVRYEWFDEILRNEGFDYLATAHHLKDSVETFFMNFGRGTGLAGLTGIPLQRMKIIRPMSCLSPEEIEYLLNEKQILWREDSSNETTKYLRNKVRKKLLPEVEKIFPEVYEKSLGTLHNLKGDYLLIQELVQRYKEDLLEKNADLYHWNLAPIKDHPAREHLLFYLLKDWNFNGDQIRQIWQAYEHQDGAQFFVQTIEATIRNKQLIIDANPPNQHFKLTIAEGTQNVVLPGGQLKITQASVPQFFPSSKNIAYLDWHKIKWPLLIRHWENGDQFQPLGMNGKNQKLQDFFSNNKYSIPEKKRQLLLINKNEIAWIINQRIAHPFAVDDSTKVCLQLTWTSEEEN